MTTAISNLKDLVKAIEKSKNYIEEHELLSDEELNTLRQTSSLVAKFQKEALTERENRRSAELQAKEKERLVSDAWRIVSALKKDKFSLENQLEKMKKNRSATNMDRLKKGRREDQYNNGNKSDHTDKTTTQTLGATPKEEEMEVQSSDGLTPTSSSDSKEKQDSIKESSTEGELSVDSDLMEELRRILMEEDSALEQEEDETEICRDVTDKHYNPSDMIRLFTAKPYVPTKKTYGGGTESSKWSTGSSPTYNEVHSEKDGCVLQKSFRTDGQESIDVNVNGHSVNVKVNIPRLPLEDDLVVDTSEDRRRIRESLPKHEFSRNSGIGTKGSRKRESVGSAIPEEKDKFGKHAPRVVSPLVLNSRSSSNKTTRPYREYSNMRNAYKQDRAREYGKPTKCEEKGYRRPYDSRFSKTDMRLIDTPGGLPGGIVSKRIQDLAKRLRIGRSAAVLKNDKGMLYSDCMDLRNPAPGLCGLENLGNSCFMNAGLQCLFVVKPFYRFFLEGGHINALKTKSKSQQTTSLCELLGRLIDKVFSGCYLTCEPSALFTSLQNKFSQLDGFIQHDCQEFLALFLDALHQELNIARVNHKRRIRQLDMSHAKNADQWWRLYNDENESVIVDTFQGQFRNKIRCTDCGHVSLTYQLFSFLSLPLVSQKLQTFVITFMRNNEFEHANSGKPRALRVRVQASKPSTTIQIKQRLVSLFPVDEQPDFNNLFLAVVRDGAIIGLLHDQRIVIPFNDKQTKLYAYEPLYPPNIPFFTKDKTNTRNGLESKHSNELHDTSRVFLNERKTILVPIGSTIHVNSVKGSYACNEGRGKTRASLPIGYHLTYTCSICLQAKPSKQLLQHDECGKVFCRECLEVSMHEDNIPCPDCGRPSSAGHSQESNPQYFNVPVVFRHKEADEDDSTLFGHPNLVTLPSKIPGQDLYHHMALLLPGSFSNKKIHEVQSLPFTLHLVNYQGRTCSRCDGGTGCTGCCIKEDDVIVFQNGDHIAIQLTNMIQLEIDKMSRYTDHESMRIKHFTCKLQLQDCLRSFVDREELQDLWECPECNQERSATKSMSISRYPDTLIIHLKRYRQSYMKIFTPVEFPLEDLDVSEFMHGINSPRDSFGAGDHIYDLIGCVCHEGDFESGHYKTYTRHGIKAEWHLFDDYKVSKECPSSLCHTSAYLLFYNRRSSSPLCTSMIEDASATQTLNSNLVRRRSNDVKSTRTDQRHLVQRNTSTEKTKDSVLLPNKPQPEVDLGFVVNASNSLTEEMIDCNKGLSSTPKERITKTNSPKEKRKESYDRNHYNDQEDQPAQCDCSQCEYYREIEQQLRRCRQSVSGSETRSSVASSSGVSPKTKQPRQTTPTKRTITTVFDNEPQIPESPEKIPQLASSDSLDSELLYDDSKIRRRSRRRSNQKPYNRTPSTSSCEAPTESDNELQNIRLDRKDKETYTDSESVATEITDSAVQCTLINAREQRRTSTRSNAAQVSFAHPNNRRSTEASTEQDDKNSDEDFLDRKDVELLTRKLICAVESEDMKLAIQLLDEGANPSLPIDGISPLHLAAGMKSSLCFHFTRLLLDFGADPNVKSSEGLTPVHVASVWGRKECLKLLLKKGGNPYSEDLEGRTAVDLARDYEDDTSANTSEYLSKLDRHYNSMIHSRSCSNTSSTADISVSELDYMPYIHGEEDNRPRRIQRQLEEIANTRPEIASSTGVLGCGSWTRGLKTRVRRSKVVRSVSGNLRRTSSRLANRFRSFSGHFGTSSDNLTNV